MKFLTFLVFLLASTGALAGDVVLEWTAPTVCVGDKPISQCPTTGYSIHFGTVAGTDVSACTLAALTQTRTHMFPNSLGTPVTGLSPGNYCFAVKTIAASGTSVHSNMLFQTVVAPLPNPPVLRTATRTVMSVKADWEKLAFVPSQEVGTIPLGSLCDPEKALPGGFYAVDRALVEWSGANRPANVVARCSL